MFRRLAIEVELHLARTVPRLRLRPTAADVGRDPFNPCFQDNGWCLIRESDKLAFIRRVRAIEASAHVTLTSAEAKDGRKGFLYEASSAAERDNARPLVHALLVDVSADIMKRREEVEAAASQPPPATCPQQTAPETDPVQVRPPLLWDGERWVVHFGEEPVAYATVPGAYEAALGQLPGQDALQVLAAYGQDAVEPGRGLGPYEWGPAPYELNSAASDGATLERWVSIGGLEGYVTQEVKAAGQANQAVSTGLPAASTDRKPAVQTVPKEPDEHLWRAPGVFATRLYRAGAHFERISEEVRELNLLEPLPPGVFAVPEQPPRGDKSPLPSKPVALGTASTKSPQRASDRSAPVLEPQPSMAVHTGGEGAETSEGELAPPGSDAERAALCAMTEWLRVDAEAPVPVSGGASHDVRREGGSGFGLRSGARSGSGVAISSLHPGATLPASASLQNGEPAKAQSLLQGAATVPSSGTEDASQTRQSGTGEQCQSLAAMDDGFEMIPRNGTAAPLSASGAGGAVVWNFPGGGESTGKGLTGCSTGPGLVKKALGESPWAVPGGVFGAACSAPSDDVWGSPTARSDSRERATREEEGANGGDVSTDGATTAPECFSEATSRPTSLVASGSTEILDPGEGAQDEVTSKVRGPGE